MKERMGIESCLTRVQFDLLLAVGLDGPKVEVGLVYRRDGIRKATAIGVKSTLEAAISHMLMDSSKH